MRKKEKCPHCGKSFVYINRHKCKANKKQESENDSQSIVEFRKCKIRKIEVNVLEEIEDFAGKKFTSTKKIKFNNKLTFIHKNNRITGLGLNKCGLTALPESVTKLNSLEVLWLFGNTISVIPNSFKKLTNLKGLCISENQLTTLPEQVCELKSLIHLNINNNNLKILPECIDKLTSLTDLWSIENQ